MITALKNITVNSMIGMLPSVINYNNQSIETDFGYIFDYDKGCYTHDLINPKGLVKAHWGEFVNLTIDTLRIKDPSSLFNSTFKGISHNQWTERFVNEDALTEDDKEKYCHDIASIKGLEERLKELENKIAEFGEIYKRLTATDPFDNVWEAYGSQEASGPWTIGTTSQEDSTEDASTNSGSENFRPHDENLDPTELNLDSSTSETAGERLGAAIPKKTVTRNKRKSESNKNVVNEKGNETEYTYPKSLLTESKAVIKKQSLYPGDYRDLQACKIYHYIDTKKGNVEFVKISNAYQYAFNNAEINQEIYLLCRKADNNDSDFIIKLDGCLDKHLYISSTIQPEQSVKLICYKVDRALGSCWKLDPDEAESLPIEIK